MRKRLLPILFSALVAFGLFATTAYADAGVAIDAANFPDEQFRTIVGGFDTDGDDSLSDEEIAAVTKIETYDQHINDMTGIKYFTALKEFGCSGLFCAELDLSSNSNLEKVSIDSFYLRDLNLDGLDKLKELGVMGTRLTALDLSGCPALTRLTVRRNNSLTSLDVSKNTALTYLDCGMTFIGTGVAEGNAITKLDLSNNKDLTILSCVNNNLTELDLSHNTKLKEVWCEGNRLIDLDLSKLSELNRFDLGYQSYTVELGEDRTFDLATLSSSFDPSNIVAGSLTGGTIDGTVVTFDEGSDSIDYRYDCNSQAIKGIYISVNLKVKPPHVHHSAGNWYNDEKGHYHWCYDRECPGRRYDDEEHTFAWVTEDYPTTEEPGYRVHKCTVCDYIDQREVIPALAPSIIEGENQTVKADGATDATFRSNAAYDTFEKVLVDGKEVSSSNYTVREGSTIVTLKASYLATLSSGKHELSIVSNTGTATTAFEVDGGKVEEDNKKPANGTTVTTTTTVTVNKTGKKGESKTAALPTTGDATSVAGIVCLLVGVIGVVGGVTFCRKRA